MDKTVNWSLQCSRCVTAIERIVPKQLRYKIMRYNKDFRDLDAPWWCRDGPPSGARLVHEDAMWIGECPQKAPHGGMHFFCNNRRKKKQYTIGTERCPCHAVARTGCQLRNFNQSAVRKPRSGKGDRYVKPRIWRPRPVDPPHSVFR